MSDHESRQEDCSHEDALNNANRVFLAIDFRLVSVAYAAVKVARAAFPNPLHHNEVGNARLAYAWMAACNKDGTLNPADKLVSMAARATDAEVAFVCQNASLAEILPPRAENLPQPAMSAVA